LYMKQLGWMRTTWFESEFPTSDRQAEGLERQ